MKQVAAKSKAPVKSKPAKAKTTAAKKKAPVKKPVIEVEPVAAESEERAPFSLFNPRGKRTTELPDEEALLEEAWLEDHLREADDRDFPEIGDDEDGIDAEDPMEAVGQAVIRLMHDHELSKASAKPLMVFIKEYLDTRNANQNRAIDFIEELGFACDDLHNLLDHLTNISSILHGDKEMVRASVITLLSGVRFEG